MDTTTLNSLTAPATRYGIRLEDGTITIAREYTNLATAVNEAKGIARDQHRVWEVLEVTYYGPDIQRRIRPIARVDHHGARWAEADQR